MNRYGLHHALQWDFDGDAAQSHVKGKTVPKEDDAHAIWLVGYLDRNDVAGDLQPADPEEVCCRRTVAAGRR